MGATSYQAALYCAQQISIHAPAMGATRAFGDRPLDFQISIHAPAMGATTRLRTYDGRLVISIHAPAMGATGV